MFIKGGVRFTDNGIKTALKAMQAQQEIVGIANQNVGGFDKVGYQRKETVVSSFSEFIGAQGISQTVDDTVGRISTSEGPLDLAISTKGYFQIKGNDGVKMTRDGRFKLDKEGNLLTLENQNVLSNAGVPIKLHILPEKLTDVVVNTKGQLSVFNKKFNKLENVATIGVVDANGAGIVKPEIMQGYLEYSNVTLQNEFLHLMPTIKAFEANRQMFMMENSILQKTISQLSSAQ